jgi:predicted  nucleic acid-binding Zn-ribbon protein
MEEFIDLRLNQSTGQAEESFWPSFTDIMTVIMMIFMLAMVILMLRNMELLHQLRSTMEAEKQASELARTTGEENATLEEKLIARESEISMLRMQQLRMKEHAEEQEAAISSQRHQINNLTRERDLLDTQAATLNRESAQLRNQLTQAERNIEKLNNTLDQANERQTATQADLEALRLAFRNQGEELTATLARNEESNQQIAALKNDFSDLKIKYNRLLRPARTSKGKTVVEVRYSKSGGVFHIDYRGPGERDFSSISSKRLDQKLSRMKAKNNNLYIKVILPKDSGLSYSEAWSFTNHLHQNYDYYYQKEAQKERIIE